MALLLTALQKHECFFKIGTKGFGFSRPMVIPFGFFQFSVLQKPQVRQKWAWFLLNHRQMRQDISRWDKISLDETRYLIPEWPKKLGIYPNKHLCGAATYYCVFERTFFTEHKKMSKTLLVWPQNVECWKTSTLFRKNVPKRIYWWQRGHFDSKLWEKFKNVYLCGLRGRLWPIKYER